MLLALPLVYMWCLVAALVLGVPAFVFLLRVDLIRWWSALPVGLLIGLVMGVLVRWPAWKSVEALIQFALAGAISALVFWLVWRRAEHVA